MTHIENIKTRKTIVLRSAANYRDIAMLCRELSIARKTLYRYFEDDALFKKNVKELIGKNYISETGKLKGERDKENIKKQKYRSQKKVTSDGIFGTKRDIPNKNRTTLTITVEIPKRQTRNDKYTPAERLKVIESICNIFERGVSLEDACIACKINKNTFYRWINPNNTVYCETGLRLYKETKAVLTAIMADNQVFKASKSMTAMLSVREVVEIVKLGKIGNDGKVKPHTIRQITKTIEPSVALIRMVMERLSKSNRHTEKIIQDNIPSDDIYFLRSLTDEQIAAEMLKCKSK